MTTRPAARASLWLALLAAGVLGACGGGSDAPAGSTTASAADTTADASAENSSNAPGAIAQAGANTDATAAETAAASPDTLGTGAQVTDNGTDIATSDEVASTTATSTDTVSAQPTVTALAVNAADVSVPGAVTVPYPTLQNLSVEWAFTGDANANASVSVRYRKAGSTTWLQGMPLRRVPGGTNKGYTWATRHTGSVFDLQPATTYDIELTLKDADGGGATKVVQATTRAVPAAMAGAPVKPATPSTIKTVLAGAQPGDVIELAAGTYSGLSISKDGTAGKPIVIRRAASAAAGSVIYNGELGLIYRKYVHIEGLTINGRIRFNASVGIALIRNTVNANANVGGGDGIVTYLPSENAYIADNTVIGTTTWGAAALGVSGANRGEGILVNGPGHVVMNNRVRGFRDNISFLEGEQALTQYSIDVLNNDLSEAADDAIEADYCHHNCRIMRNRITNAFIAMSSQPTLGGPAYYIRNVMYNVAHVAFKLYNGTVGDVLLHNTVVKNGDGFGEYAGASISRLYTRNNLFIGGTGGTYGGYSSGSGSPLYAYDLVVAGSDLNYDAFGSTNNAFSGRFGPSIRYTGLAQLRSNTTEKNAVQVDMTAFAANVAFPSAPMSQYTAPDLRPKATGGAANVGVVIPNVNDGFVGTAPDAGAYEAGAALPVYGPR